MSRHPEPLAFLLGDERYQVSGTVLEVSSCGDARHRAMEDFVTWIHRRTPEPGIDTWIRTFPNMFRLQPRQTVYFRTRSSSTSMPRPGPSGTTTLPSLAGNNVEERHLHRRRGFRRAHHGPIGARGKLLDIEPFGTREDGAEMDVQSGGLDSTGENVSGHGLASAANARIGVDPDRDHLGLGGRVAGALAAAGTHRKAKRVDCEPRDGDVAHWSPGSTVGRFSNAHRAIPPGTSWTCW